MTRTSSILSALLLAHLGVAAPQVAAQSATQATVSPRPNYTAGDLYLPTSRVYALVGKTGLGHEHGVTGAIKSGRLLLGATQDAGELVFDMASFTADTDAARKFVGLEGSSTESTRTQVTENMLGQAVLNAAIYPTATFKIESAVEEPGQAGDGAKRYRLSGQFTLQKVTRPLSLVAEVDNKNGWNRVRGRFNLKQSDFGMKPFTKAFGAIGVADEMTVWGELWVAPSAGMAQQQGGVTTR